MQCLKRIRLLVLAAVVLFVFTLGCASPPKVLDRAIPGPQVVMNPQMIPLGAAKLMGTDFIFDGSGFDPGDTVFISLIGKPDINVSLALAKVAQDGTFRAEMGQAQSASIAKLTGILRAASRTNEKMQSVLVLTQPTIPKGAYTIRASSLMTAKTAETPVAVSGPSIIHSLMDMIGGILGKIEDKR
ncbi:MAG: hypothetical protein QMD32_00115 [Smithellaceae bacterium]|nr:hypothetical protein [Smithellaceae bacterium]